MQNPNIEKGQPPETDQKPGYWKKFFVYPLRLITYPVLAGVLACFVATLNRGWWIHCAGLVWIIFIGQLLVEQVWNRTDRKITLDTVSVLLVLLMMPPFLWIIGPGTALQSRIVKYDFEEPVAIDFDLAGLKLQFSQRVMKEKALDLAFSVGQLANRTDLTNFEQGKKYVVERYKIPLESSKSPVELTQENDELRAIIAKTPDDRKSLREEVASLTKTKIELEGSLATQREETALKQAANDELTVINKKLQDTQQTQYKDYIKLKGDYEEQAKKKGYVTQADLKSIEQTIINTLKGDLTKLTRLESKNAKDIQRSFSSLRPGEKIVKFTISQQNQ